MTFRHVVLVLALAFSGAASAVDPPEQGYEAGWAVEAGDGAPVVDDDGSGVEAETETETETETVVEAEAEAAVAEEPQLVEAQENALVPQVSRLPAMSYASSIAGDKVLEILKRNPALSAIDEELAGSPLILLVTHTLRPTAGGQAAGALSGALAGGTLGLIPIVSSEVLVLRYEVLLNGKPVTSYNFERTATRAMNLWSAGKDDGYEGLGRAGMEWVESTAVEAAASLAADPALDAVRREIEYYFPSDG